MVVHIAKVRSYSRASRRKIVPSQLIANLDHRRDCMAHFEKSGAQPIDALDLFGGRNSRKKIVFDDFQLFCNLVDDGDVIVADKINNGIKYRALSEAKELRATL